MYNEYNINEKSAKLGDLIIVNCTGGQLYFDTVPGGVFLRESYPHPYLVDYAKYSEQICGLKIIISEPADTVIKYLPDRKENTIYLIKDKKICKYLNEHGRDDVYCVYFRHDIYVSEIRRWISKKSLE